LWRKVLDLTQGHQPGTLSALDLASLEQNISFLLDGIVSPRPGMHGLHGLGYAHEVKCSLGVGGGIHPSGCDNPRGNPHGPENIFHWV